MIAFKSTTMLTRNYKGFNFALLWAVVMLYTKQKLIHHNLFGGYKQCDVAWEVLLPTVHLCFSQCLNRHLLVTYFGNRI